MISKLLIANRGEIACRVIRTARMLGVQTVAVYSDADATAMHVQMADEAVRIGSAEVGESYLRGKVILEAAKTTGADAIHPGYGFLSENPDFVEAVEAAGLTFVGPSAKAIRAMGLKDQAKALMERAGVPVVPGYHGADQDADLLADEAAKIGYPVMIKARAGGGGKGMRLVEDPAQFADALASAQREGQASFGDAAVLIEKFIQNPRHIEVQVFGDAHGNVIHLGERDCSLQRRHQKVIEEAPAPGMTEELRAAMGAAAVAAAKAVDYQGAGTVEFIADGSGPLRSDGFWFMEMNTRLQVEHPVTEAITGLDLVALQLSVALGAPLPLTQDDVKLTGHAVEARLYAEDAGAGFLPATGTLSHLRFGGELRVDTGVQSGDTVTPFYDPMIAKLIAHGPNRAAAFAKLAKGLVDTQIAGCVTNRAFLHALVSDADVCAGRVDTGLIARRGEALLDDPIGSLEVTALAALAHLWSEAPLAGYRHFGPARQSVAFEGTEMISVERTGTSAAVILGEDRMLFEEVTCTGHTLQVAQSGRMQKVAFTRARDGLTLHLDAHDLAYAFKDPAAGVRGAGADRIDTPMPGRVIACTVAAGQHVQEGDTLMVLEAMKMEHPLIAPRDGTIAEVLAAEGDQVEQGALLVRLDAL
ncbi:MAG: acetyl/propionyl/methylcrotonyl-CoA carboxylase subunit alpha [Marinovum sp.]|nr:acetyl/propionyl/methylcrotonyl-CoA carboxylase subunit alpha [Marinovum sp.]